MRIYSSLKALILAIPATSRATLETIVESVRTLFGGDAETRRQVAFSIAMIALSAKMAKADGIVTDNEVAAFQQIFAIPDDEARNVFRLYNLAKQDVAGFDAYASRLSALCKEGYGDAELLADILDGLFHIAKADSLVHERELAFLGEVAAIFGLTEHEFERIRLRHVGDGSDNPYAVLDLEPGVSREVARKRYLDLVRENHPDRLAARGVPDEFMLIATERMKAINAAYEAITTRQPS